MNIAPLISTGRLDPVLKQDLTAGIIMLLGWRRKPNSRKNQSWTLKRARPWQAPVAALKKTAGEQMMATERQRQIAAEGYSAAHDDQHTGQQIAKAAACYRHFANLMGQGVAFDQAVVRAGKTWPWDTRHWKPTEDVIRARIRAGALFWAEGDRLVRAGASYGELKPLWDEVDVQAALIDVELKKPAGMKEGAS